MSTNVTAVFVLAVFPCNSCDEPHNQATTVPLDPDGRITQPATRPQGTLLCPKCLAHASRDPLEYPREGRGRKPKEPVSVEPVA